MQSRHQRLDRHLVVLFVLTLISVFMQSDTAKKRRKSYFDFTSDLPLSYLYQNVQHTGTYMNLRLFFAVGQSGFLCHLSWAWPALRVVGRSGCKPIPRFVLLQRGLQSNRIAAFKWVHYCSV